jgi:hypothetical protein
MSMRGIHHKHIHPGRNKQFRSSGNIRSYTDSGTDAKSPSGTWQHSETPWLSDILDGDDPFNAPLCLLSQLFHLVLHEMLFASSRAYHPTRDEIRFGHETGNRLFVVSNERRSLYLMKGPDGFTSTMDHQKCESATLEIRRPLADFGVEVKRVHYDTRIRSLDLSTSPACAPEHFSVNDPKPPSLATAMAVSHLSQNHAALQLGTITGNTLREATPGIHHGGEHLTKGRNRETSSIVKPS